MLERASQAGVADLVITGTDLAASAAAAQAATETNANRATGAPRLWATAGIHPHDAANAPAGWRADLGAIARRPGVVAIGETGLDFNRNFSPPDVQQAVFLEQLSLAAELSLPVFVHERDAAAAVYGCLQEAADFDCGVVVHCFTGDRDALDGYLDLGCHIGITGWVCDRRRGAALRELAPHIPLHRLMVETDSPFLRPHNAPRDAHGRRNEPGLLPYVIQQLATLYGASEQHLADLTAANARAFFGLEPRPSA